jgi:signal peptidase I
LAPEQQDTFYIKRLVGLAGETVSIRQDHEVSGVPTFGVDAATVPVGTVMIDGKPLSATTQHFENLYAFSGAAGASTPLPYRDNSYFGHALIWLLSPGQNYQIRPDRLWVMGDNTMNSLDSRSWGDFDAHNVIGRAFWVYWPVTTRFGWDCVNH